MIRPVTCLCLIAAGASGLYLYSEKHRTALLDRDIGRVIHLTEAARARTGLLRAEWALLNEPGRLQDMAGRYLALHSMAPTQFVQIADLSAHLPAPSLTPAGAGTDEDDAPAAGGAPDAASGGVAMAGGAPDIAAGGTVVADAAAAFPAHHPMQPPGKTDPHAGLKLARADAPHADPARADPAHADGHRAPHRVLLADRGEPSVRDGLMARSTPLPLAAPQPMGANVYSAMARPMRLQAPRQTIVAGVPSYAPAYGSSPAFGSALGGRASLPPPVPFGR